MHHPVRKLAVALAAMVAIGYAGSAHATCQIPLAIGQTTGEANVLILQDNSGSMNEALVSSSYNPKTTYAGKFTSGTTYNISTSGNYTPRSFNSKWVNTPSAYLVASDQGEDGRYDGNYLNWIYFTATSAQRAAIPVITRIQAAKPVVSQVLGSVSGCRFAVEVFNNDNGGKIISPFGSTIAAMQSQIMAIDADSWTPLAESMITAMNYFKKTDSTAPIQASCQKSFVIIVTDGLPTQDTSVPAYIKDVDKDGYYLDDVASYLYKNDMRPDMDGMQNVATFTIGFNVDANLLQKTSDKGGGAYFSINDGAGLVNALTASFNVIAARIASGTAVSVVSSEDRTNNRLYRARYESQTWRGFVESFNLPYHGGDSPLWEAGALLQAQSSSSRTLLTSTTGTNTYPLTAANAASLRTLLGAADNATATNIINFTRGDSTPGSRSRLGWKLGDIVDAAPVTVGKPNGFNNFLNYWSFRSTRAGRSEVVYVGANDGMLHCIDATNGSEKWAYVPKNHLPNLSGLMDPSYCHHYYLNMTPAVYDIYMNGAWKTVLIGGEGQGGNSLFALNVTSPAPDTVSVLWDVDMPSLKGSWNGPSLVRDKRLDAYVLCVGTGYDPASAQTNLFVLNPTDGSVMSTIALGTAVSANKTTKATALDRDFDGYDDLLYLGDLAGNIWRVDLTTNPYSVSKLYNCGKPIQAAPVVTMDQAGHAMIFFGTGEYLTDSDPSTTNQQAIYGLIDNNSGGTIATSELVDQTSTFTGLSSGKRGWFMNLVQSSGERVTHTAVLIAGTLYVPSFLPNNSACTGGGQSWLYSLDYKDGSYPDNPNGTANNTTDDRVQSMGDGILADPSVDLLSEQVILQSSNAVLLTENIGGGLKKLMVRSWRQKWN
jgi:type IV pilus assembly protein PilY1